MRSLLLIIITCLCATPLLGQSPAVMAPAPLKDTSTLEWWREARFGMFIHWGPVALTGGEIGWSRGRPTPIDEYDNLYKKFNPVKFDADAWAKAAKDAGMKYVVLTTKHHDGFCLWDTRATGYNIMNSPFKRDVVKELADACRRHGLRFGTYYSVCDWWHPDFPLGSPGGKTKKPEPNLDRYMQYLETQVKELVNNYGPLVTMWFDVPQEVDAAHGVPIVNMLRTLQPDILINNRAYRGFKGDYATPEQKVGGFNMDHPWETCMTICRQWAWKPNDQMKPLEQCVRTLISCAAGDGNLLFNVGPTAEGEIEPRQVERLREMGQWLARFGDHVYGTRGGPFKPGKWGGSTRKGNRVTLFVMNWPTDGALHLPLLQDHKIVKVRTLTGGDENATRVDSLDRSLAVVTPAEKRDAIATVIELTLDGQAMDIAPMDVNDGMIR